MRTDSTGPQVLSRTECLELLASTPIGRLVFTDRALPAVQPVNFVLNGQDVVIRARAGSKLDIIRNAVVAFEADEFDSTGRTGWSVTAIGQAHSVHDPDQVDRLAHLPLAPWASGTPDHFIVVPVGLISGRRIPPRTRQET